MMPVPSTGVQDEGGLAVAGVAHQRDARAVKQGDFVVGKLEEDSRWTAGGVVQEVCHGSRCFIVQWKKLYQHKTSSRQHMEVTWGSQQQPGDQGVKFASKANTSQAQGVPAGLRGLTRGGTPCSVWTEPREKVLRTPPKRRQRSESPAEQGAGGGGVDMTPN